MEETLKRNSPALSRDHASVDMEDCASESTLSHSVQSGVTVDSSRFPHRACDGDEKLDDSTGWTNEKHNSYLYSLETSFVKQLHHSISLRRWRAEVKFWGPFSTRERKANTYNSVDKFPGRGDGCWQGSNFDIKETSRGRAAASHILENPWVQRLSSSSKYQHARPVLLQSVEGADEIKKRGRMDFSAETSRDEASDQNFVESEEKANVASSVKRPRRAGAADASSNDQVVPLGKFHETQVSDVSQGLTSMGTQRLLSGHLERLASKNADLNYFLRGS